jgi:hypothetical protein
MTRWTARSAKGYALIGSTLSVGLILAGCSTAATSDSVVGAAPTSYVGPAGNCAGKAPCFPDLQAAIDAAQANSTITVLAGSYAVATPSAPGTPAINVTKSLTIMGEGSPSAPGCATSCPTFELGDGTSLGLQIAADGVKLSNLAINQKSVPGSDYAAGLVYIPANGTGLYSRPTLDHVSLTGGRRAVWLNAADPSITSSSFNTQATDSIFVTASSGNTTIKDNTFGGGGKGKDVLFEAQQSSPVTSGNISITGNTAYTKANFFLWNSWSPAAAKQSVDLTIDHNSVVNTTSASIVFLPSANSGPGFGVFKGVNISNTIVQGAGGDAVFVDYRYSPADSSVPAQGQIGISNVLTFKNTASGGVNDPTNNFGISTGAPSSATLDMFKVSTNTNINDKDPLLVAPASGDFSLATGSPAIGTGTNKSNIGAWQGSTPGPTPGKQPKISQINPFCGRYLTPVAIVGHNFTADSVVKFGTTEVNVVKFSDKKKDTLYVTAPKLPVGWSSITVTNAAGSATKKHGFLNAGHGGCLQATP